MQAAVVYTWGVPRLGREQAALTSFADAMTFWGKRQADGIVDLSVPVLTPPSGGLWVITGDEEELTALTKSEEHRRIVIAAGGSVEDFGFIIGATGDALEEQMALYGRTINELGWS